MEWEADEKEVKAAGAEHSPDGRRGLRIHGWEIESSNRSVLTSLNLQSKGYPSDSAPYNDPNIISQRLPIVFHKTQKLKIPDTV